jgi:hypothetical protein
MNIMRGFAGGLLLVLCSASFASAQLTCFVNAGVPPLVRTQGLAELTGDVVLVCNGTSGAGGTTADITVFLNTTLTSKLIGGVSEALLLVGEPAPGAQTLGTNVFQVTVSAGNAVQFSGIQVAPAGAVTNRVLRIVNIRVNANALGPGVPVAQVVSFVSVSNATTTISLTNPQQTVAFSQNGATFDAQCSSTALTMNLVFAEGFQTSFKPIGGTGQNTPGSVFNTESGFTPSPTIAGVGTATSGTQFGAALSGLPSGVQLSVPALVSAGGFTATAVTPSGGGVVPIAGGAATIVYEAIATTPFANETFTIPVSVSTLPTTGATVRLGLYPLSTQTTASATAPLPRFADVSLPLAFGSCGISVPTMDSVGLFALAMGLLAAGSLTVRRFAAR